VARLSSDDPFALTFEVPVAGGKLNVAQAGPPATAAEGLAIAAHGLTTALTWRTVARRLDESICLLAPDLRGRGRSANVPGPYGMAAHVADLIAVLDHVGAPAAVLVGHSLGAYVVERLAGEHPERATAVALVDSGLPLTRPGASDEIAAVGEGRAMLPLSITYPSADWAVQAWRGHPAMAEDWDEDIEAYVRYNLAERGASVGLCASAAAVRTDLTEMAVDGANRTALERVRAPVHLLRAERGVLNDDPVISEVELREFAAAYPSVRIEEVPGTNHYTIVLGPGPGPYRVAAAIEGLCRGRPHGSPDRRNGQPASRDPRMETQHADLGL
jgi:pimeloyl-ACP methyl ester carboxylesterase